jgi:hypothetical protein
MLKKTRSTLMRRTAVARSAGVRNHAVVGESGKRNLMNMMKNEKLHPAMLKMAYQNAIAVRSVKIPVIIMSLDVLDRALCIRQIKFSLPLPWCKSLRLGMQASKTDEARDDLG